MELKSGSDRCELGTVVHHSRGGCGCAVFEREDTDFIKGALTSGTFRGQL